MFDEQLDTALAQPDSENTGNIQSRDKMNLMLPNVTSGKIVGFGEQRNPQVEFRNKSGKVVIAYAATVVDPASLKVDDRVVLSFDGGDVQSPIVMGVLCNLEVADAKPTDDFCVTVDGERVSIEASREIQLKCGDASITLTKAGKILIRGAYVLSRSSGVNRVKGGVVHIN